MTTSNTSTPARYSHVSPRNYTRILKAEQARREPVRPAKPVIKSAPTPATNPMTLDQKARMAAAFAEMDARRAAA